MKRILFYLIFLFKICVTSVNAQDTIFNLTDSLGRQQGVWKIYTVDNNYNNKYIHAIETYKDGLRDGRCIYYYDNGKIQSDNMYTRDSLNGERKIYRDDGSLYHIERYKMGRWHGMIEYYNEEGKITEAAEYREGHLNGLVRNYYFTSHRLESETTIIDDVEEGTRKIYEDSEANELIREFDFKNGERVSSRYYKHGKLVKEVNN